MPDIARLIVVSGKNRPFAVGAWRDRVFKKTTECFINVWLSDDAFYILSPSIPMF
ncbi:MULTISPECIES: hypothetical protein [Pseudomonas]|uniref:hypothetical protein n=1 Tax=Pseudomonas TaxID=286 RepID=UPI000A5CA1D9|nr:MULTISPECIES: hypothetical protein [Pseudomonas]